MKTTRTRAIRPHFFQSSIVFGVRLGDWKFIGIVAVIGFVSAIVFQLQIKGFNLALPFFFFSVLAGAAFFNWVRKNHRPRWLEYQLAFLWRAFRRKSSDLDRQPILTERRISWLIDGETLPVSIKE